MPTFTITIACTAQPLEMAITADDKDAALIAARDYVEEALRGLDAAVGTPPARAPYGRNGEPQWRGFENA